MKRSSGWISKLAVLCIAMFAMFMSTTAAWADKIHLKDGRVVEGTITEETDDYIRVKIKIGGIEHTDLFDKKDVKSIDRDSVTNPTPAPSTTTPAGKPAAKKAGKGDVHRVAMLHFGPPSSWGGIYDDMVGREVSAAAFERAIPLLEKDGVTDVIVRINSGGGALMELEPFHRTFEKYKQKFRTVAWVESAISAAAMAPWVLEEFYMMPNGNIGACTGWSGALTAVKGIELEQVLIMMEKASKKANRSPFIMRAMQIMDPLSATIDPVTGNVEWKQSTAGNKILNPPGQVLTLNAQDAVEYKFAKAICASKEELVETMLGKGVEYEWAGAEATALIDNSIKTNDKANKEAVEVVVKYVRAIQEAASIQDREERGAAVGRARRMLGQLESWVKQNPNQQYFLANYVGAILDREYFTIQRERLRELAR